MEQLSTRCCIVGGGPCGLMLGFLLARAGIDALIQLAGGKTPRGRTGLLCENPQVQDAVGRADAMLNAGRVYRNAMIAEAFKIHSDDIGHIPLHQQALAWAMKKNVELVQLADNFNLLKWVVIK